MKIEIDTTNILNFIKRFSIPSLLLLCAPVLLCLAVLFSSFPIEGKFVCWAIIALFSGAFLKIVELDGGY